MVERRHTHVTAASAVGVVTLILVASSCQGHRGELSPRMAARSTRLVVRWTPTTHAQNLRFRDRCHGGELFSGSKGLAGRLLSMRRRGQSGSPGKSSCELFQPPRRVQAAKGAASARDLDEAVEVWELVANCDADESAPIRLRNHYYPKSGRDREVLDWRLHACDVREQLGRPRGCVWKLRRGPAGAPRVMWELPVRQITEELISVENAAASTAEFRGVIEHMKTLLDRFEPETWDVVGQ